MLFSREDEVDLGDRLAELLDIAGVGNSRRVGDVQGFALASQDLIGDVGRCLNQGQVALALQPLLDDFHVQHAQEAAPEAETERVGRLGLEEKLESFRESF